MRSTYEDREGTLWVCTVAGLDAFDRRTEKVTERIRLNVPESLEVKALEDHAGVLWIIYTSGNGLASWDRHTRRLTLYSFKDREPPASRAQRGRGNPRRRRRQPVAGDNGSGLVKIDRSRRSAVRYRHSPLDPDSISERHAHVGVRGPRGEHLGGHGDDRSWTGFRENRCRSSATAMSPTIRRAFCERPSPACMRTARRTSGWAAPSD